MYILLSFLNINYIEFGPLFVCLFFEKRSVCKISTGGLQVICSPRTASQPSRGAGRRTVVTASLALLLSEHRFTGVLLRKLIC